jgi:branched-chain amino acid transport system ATP-binding protein
VQQIGAMIRTLKAKGFTILLVEQNFHFASTVADRHYVVEHGTVVDMIGNDALEANKGKLQAYLGV